MSDSKLTHLVVFFLLIAATSCEEKVAPRVVADAPVDFAKAIDIAARYDAGAKAVVVSIAIAPGFHAYAEGETVGKPLKLVIAPGSPVELKDPRYPSGTQKMLPIGRSMVVEGKAEIVAPVVLKGTAEPPPAGTAIKAQLSYQVCKETACDRPRTLDLELST